MWGKQGFLFIILFLFAFEGRAQSYAWKIREKSFEIFDTKIRPPLQKGYAQYRKNYGDQFGEDLLDAYDFLTPKADKIYGNTKSYWYYKNPQFFDDLARVPTPAKIAYEKFMFVIWGAINKSEQAGKMGEQYATATKMVGEAYQVRKGNLRVSSEDQERLERLLNDLRNYSPDKEMAPCFVVYGVPSDIENAFNTGCSIFVNRKLYNMLDDDELRAVLAHEMSHGALGHGIKTFGQIIKNLVKTVGQYDLDGMTWILTDEETESFKEVNERGLLDTFAEKTAEQAPRLELEADIGGTKLLNDAGYSANALISALYKLHGIKPGEEDKNQGDFKSLRNYPSLYRRLQAIREHMRY